MSAVARVKPENSGSREDSHRGATIAHCERRTRHGSIRTYRKSLPEWRKSGYDVEARNKTMTKDDFVRLRIPVDPLAQIREQTGEATLPSAALEAARGEV